MTHKYVWLAHKPVYQVLDMFEMDYTNQQDSVAKIEIMFRTPLSTRTSSNAIRGTHATTVDGG